MLTAPSLTTARLALRPVTPADRADLIALEADPAVMRFLNGGRPVPEAGWPDGSFLTPRGTEPEVLAAHTRATGDFVGWFALFDDGVVGGLKTAEIGYRLRHQAWGQGYATEGVLALTAEALGRLGFARVRAETMATNIASCRVLEKAGFRQVETGSTRFAPPVPGNNPGEIVFERVDTL